MGPEEVRLSSEDDKLRLRSHDQSGGRVRVLLGDAPPTPSGGGGGWEAVARPGRRPILVYRGPDEPYRILLPLLVEGFGEASEQDGLSIEADLRILERMAGMNVPNDPVPPFLIVEGSLPHDQSEAAQNRWVIEKSPEWGDAIRRGFDGHRVRAAVTITLALYTEGARLDVLKHTNGPKYDMVVALKGDTYAKVAGRELSAFGGRRLGAYLARLNGKGAGSVNATLKTGTHVRLPTTGAAQDWAKALKKGN